MISLVARSYAKINLGLDVLGRFPDGYHELFTTFQAIDLHDTLTFERSGSGGIQLISANPDFPLGPENLIFRVLTETAKYVNHPVNIRVTVDKQIPIAAGLGGGSSNAAATIKAAVKLFNLPLSTDELTAWAAKLGADIPFFLGNAQAEGRGRGDRLDPVDFYADYWLIILKPAASLSAREVYAALDLSLTRKRIGVSFASCRDEAEFFSEVSRAENALTMPVLQLCPAVGNALRFLEGLGPVVSRISGSGPCVYGIFRERPSRQEIERRIPDTGWRIYLSRPLRGVGAVVLESQTGAKTDRLGADRGNL